MMEEASDEQPEMVTHEEAMQAEIEATANIPPSLAATPQKPSPSLGAPSPLPAFLSKSTADSKAVESPKDNSPPPSEPVNISSVSLTSPSHPVSITSPSVSPPTQVNIASPLLTSVPESQQMIHEDDTDSDVHSSASNTDTDKAQTTSSGFLGWISSSSLVNRVVEKTKTSMESVITTLDPGMKSVMHSGGDIEIVVTSTKESKVLPIREAFQNVFGRATVNGKASQATTAAQPVGFTAGLKGAEDRITNLRQSGSIPDSQAIVSVEGFIVEMLPDRWFEMSVLLLRDPSHGVELQTFSQPTLIPNEYIIKAQEKTPSDYPLKWAGLAVTIGAVIEDSQPHIGHTDWQSVLSGVSRQQSLQLAAQSLAHMYKERLPTSFVS